MATNKGITRRTFIKGSVATSVLASMGATSCSLREVEEDVLDNATQNDVPDTNTDAVSTATLAESTVFNCCPRNCYDTCSIKTVVEDGVIKYVKGNENNTYTAGKLCTKGYSYPRRVYSPDRIKYPMKQNGKGTGDWERISWDAAYEMIAKKIIEIQDKYGNTLPMCLNKYSGNFNVLSYGVEGMMSSFGHHTIAQGTPCWPAGIDAQTYDMGTLLNADPENFDKSKLIILWGVNPAWTSVHSMNIIQTARENGCKVIVIDPIITDSASKADEYIEIKTSADGALALGMCKYILDNNLQDNTWMEENSVGYQEFIDYVNTEVTVEWASEKTGISVETIERLAKEYATMDPASIWIGYGMQRHINGGMSVRAIDALVALCGNINVVGGGANYGQLDSWKFNYNAMVEPGTREDNVEANRYVNINDFGADVLSLREDAHPIEMLWIACRNPMSQDPEAGVVKQAFESVDFVVTVDQFFTKSVEMSDLVLPCTTIFETWGLHASYWHYWINGNQPAIDPLYESKSDIEIAMGISKKINELKPGSCTFPTDRTVEEWVSKELTDDAIKAFGFNKWSDIFEKGTAKVQGYDSAWTDGNFRTPSGKYEFLSETAKSMGHTDIPRYLEALQPENEFKIRLLTPHWKYSIHSQFQNLDWFMNINDEPFVEMHSELASEKGIVDGDLVNLRSVMGEIQIKAKITNNVPKNEVVIYETWLKDNDFNVNDLVEAIPADMGAYAMGQDGISFHDTFVDITKA